MADIPFPLASRRARIFKRYTELYLGVASRIMDRRKYLICRLIFRIPFSANNTDWAGIGYNNNRFPDDMSAAILATA
jgi:hypothetical protein